MICDCIHLGLPKCASSLLQQVVFKEHPSIYLYKGYDVHYFIKNKLGSSFEYDDATLRELMERECESFAPSPTSRRVLSSELLLGHYVTGYGARSSVDYLLRTLQNPKVILVLRNQYDFIFSLWRNLLKYGLTKTLSGFLRSQSSAAQTYPYFYKRSDSDRKTCANVSLFDRIQYDVIVKYLCDVLGKENVGVFFLEDLQDDFDAWVQSVYSFVEVDSAFQPTFSAKNVGVQQYLSLLRWSNILWRVLFPKDIVRDQHSSDVFYSAKFQRNVDFLVHRRKSKNYQKIRGGYINKLKRIIPPEIQQIICESNRKLSSYLDRDLANLGFSCE